MMLDLNYNGILCLKCRPRLLAYTDVTDVQLL